MQLPYPTKSVSRETRELSSPNMPHVVGIEIIVHNTNHLVYFIVLYVKRV
jgi:hypothetical protein